MKAFEEYVSGELIVGIIGVVSSAVMFFVGKRSAERNEAKQVAQDRFDTVLANFMDLRKTNRTGGLDGMRKAGAATLASDQVIRELIATVQRHGEKSPLGSNPEWFAQVDLKHFLEWSVENKIDFHRHGWDELIRQFRDPG